MKTFIIIKPDAISRGLVGKILSRFERVGMEILKIEMHHKNMDWFHAHYDNLIGKLNYNYLDEMVKNTIGHPLIGIILEGSIDKVRLMVGTTHCIMAAPGTIRGDYGIKGNYQNLIHAADSEERADTEIDLFFRSDNDY